MWSWKKCQIDAKRWERLDWLFPALKELIYEPKKCALSRSWNRQGNGVIPRTPLKGSQSCRKLDFSPERPTSAIWTPEVQYKKSVLCKPLNLWQFVTTAAVNKYYCLCSFIRNQWLYSGGSISLHSILFSLDICACYFTNTVPSWLL